MKSMDIFNARHYTYKTGEAEQLANRKFEKALREGTLHLMPNVIYFLKKREVEIEKLQLHQSEAQNTGDQTLINN